jgi:hypothetical protein
MVIKYPNTDGKSLDPGLLDLIRHEILLVRTAHKDQTSQQENRLAQIVIISCCFLVNIVFIFSRHDYIALFIAASFYLNMVYFVSLLIPTSPGHIRQITPEITRSLSWLRSVGLIPGTFRFTRLFINAFFLNSRALSAGITLIFSIDILFSLSGYFARELSLYTLLIVISQAAVIIIFYSLVWKMEPFSTKYAKNIKFVRDTLSRENIPGWVITVLFIFGFFVSFIILMTAIILLPGITTGMFLSSSGLSEIGYLVGLLAVLGFSQYFIVRFIHGISSHVLAERLFEYKERSLQQILDQGTVGNSGTQHPAGNQTETMIIFLESRIYQIRRNSFFGLFPVYVIDLDFSVMLESSPLIAISGYIHETR